MAEAPLTLDSTAERDGPNRPLQRPSTVDGRRSRGVLDQADYRTPSAAVKSTRRGVLASKPEVGPAESGARLTPRSAKVP